MSKVSVFRAATLGRDPTLLSLGNTASAQTVLKPNWVRDYNERAPNDATRMAELVTSRDLIARVACTVGPFAQKLIVADAPQFDTDWKRLSERLELPQLLRTLQIESGARSVEIRDLRQEAVVTDGNGVIVQRRMIMGDPDGYRIVDLGELSAFHGSGFDFRRLRGADYDAEVTIRHHTAGRHEYCVAATILGSDFVVDMPKVKTHKKSGVTLCLKNLVGINGNKNYLPHHRAGRPEDGGDEFPGGRGNWYRRIRAWAVDRSRPILQRGALLPVVQALRSVDVRTRPQALIRNGNWYRNDTVWRMILDLNRILLYADADGNVRERRQRRVAHVLDGIIAGDGEGPLAPDPKHLGLVIVSDDAVAADIVTAALMGFEPLKIPVIQEALKPHRLPITTLGSCAEGLEIEYEGSRVAHYSELPNHQFRPQSGWIGHIERAGPRDFHTAA